MRYAGYVSYECSRAQRRLRGYGVRYAECQAMWATRAVCGYADYELPLAMHELTGITIAATQYRGNLYRCSIFEQ